LVQSLPQAAGAVREAGAQLFGVESSCCRHHRIPEGPTRREYYLRISSYSSWLNQVELWFAKIERDVIARGIFTSLPDLKRKLMRYIRRYNEQPKPVKWKYFDPTRRITPDSIVTGH
jgi:transposase